jgi:hypothetical protein
LPQENGANALRPPEVLRMYHRSWSRYLKSALSITCRNRYRKNNSPRSKQRIFFLAILLPGELKPFRDNGDISGQNWRFQIPCYNWHIDIYALKITFPDYFVLFIFLTSISTRSSP